ncbi:GNAT family N-acetyltransferase [Dyella solisilvae]|uniref:GNAT family N-acetyltransferase n=1 Tax=Dyella solisilvae TaxID=1920168 RepID=A0A370K7B7_9GAMM|nr:GNAT family N-acetyltransferase [Dyella solisilvae]RDI97920.1 GNAT family N-acetyltransferase [Dyella solisilvae]
MRYLNQLEPDALIARFVEHPPIGFNVMEAAGTPAFVAPFDLLTTADAEARDKVVRAPGYRWWGRLLRWRTAFVGTTVSEYALFPPEAEPAALASALRRQLGRRQRLLIVKDIPQASPLFDEDTADWCHRFASACESQGFLLLEGQALAYVSIDFASEEEYLARLSSGRRKDIRRKLRKREEVEVETVRCGDALFADDAVVDAYYALYENVYAQSEIHFDKLSRDFFAAVLRDAATGGVAFVYRHQGAMIGWNLCFVVGDKLIDKYVGFAYPQAREQNLYFTSWFHNLAYAREQGLKHYVAGWTDPEIKSYLGAQFTLTRHAIYLRNPLLRTVARRLGRFFESDSQWAAHDKA